MHTLSEKEHDAFLRHLELYGKRGCPFCGYGTVGGTESLAARFTVDREEAVVGSGDDIPMVQAVCPNCGYVMQFAISHVEGVEPE